jgi:signal transduction histidine kinase
MKTMRGSTRGNPGHGLYVGSTLTLTASVTLQGAGLWLASGSGSHIGAGAIVAIAGGALACLIAGLLIGAARLRERRASAEGEPARAIRAVPLPRSEEEAAALAHAQKMEALGLLAGGVAHDFNNQLHVIRNSLEILQRQSLPAEAGRYLGMIRRSSDRAGALSRQLLAFSRRQPVELRPLDPNGLVSQVAELLRHSLGERIVIETVLGPEVADVAADAGQLETALLNLAINARDAMPQAGLLTIETANVTLDESFRSYVMIAVSDTGTGMPPEVAARACEPFFTTKEPGRGTGLGLSQVAGFAQQTGGQIRITSAPGKGTTVRLYLPEFGRLSDPERGPARPRWRAWPMKEATKGLPLAVGAGRER